MTTERKSPAPTGCREYLILIQLFIFGYILISVPLKWDELNN